jgi:hypothetical protein
VMLLSTAGAHRPPWDQRRYASREFFSIRNC